VAKVTAPAKNGFEWQLSIGAITIRTEFVEAGKTATVNGREVVGPVTISRETELKEISFVPLGADDATSVSVTASQGKIAMFKAMLIAAKNAGNIKAKKYSAEDIEKMTEEEAKAALKDTMVDAADGDEDEDEDEEVETDPEEEEPKPKAKSSATKSSIQASRKQLAAEANRVAKINVLAAKSPAIFVNANGQDVNLFAHAIE
jgi:hypothetical protein